MEGAHVQRHSIEGSPGSAQSLSETGSQAGEVEFVTFIAREPGDDIAGHMFAKYPESRDRVILGAQSARYAAQILCQSGSRHLLQEPAGRRFVYPVAPHELLHDGL